jgi:hypothetical protein
MTILNAVAAQQVSNSNSPDIAIVGIAAGASVVGVLGVAFAVAYSRRSPKQKLVNPVYHDQAVEVRHNPVRAPLERQRSMTYPVEPEAPKNVMPQGLKNPFAAKPMILKFSWPAANLMGRRCLKKKNLIYWARLNWQFCAMTTLVKY